MKAIDSEDCARTNSIFVAKFGKSHIKSNSRFLKLTKQIVVIICILIKETKIINPYGAFSQRCHQDAVNAQKQKLFEFTNGNNNLIPNINSIIRTFFLTPFLFLLFLAYVKPLNINEFKKGQ